MEVREYRHEEAESLLKVGGGIAKRRPRLLDFVEAREWVYSAVFGDYDYVYPGRAALKPRVDVYRFAPTVRRPFFTFVTAGMSDLPMHSPAERGADCRRVELVFYAAEGRAEYAGLLGHLAQFPHGNATWIHWGHTKANGSPPEPVFGSGALDCLFFMPSIVQPDARLGAELSWRGEPVHLLWCVPISTAECNLKHERGVLALCDVLRARSHPFIYAGDRASYA
jgi:hypothetical protein